MNLRGPDVVSGADRARRAVNVVIDHHHSEIGGGRNLVNAARNVFGDVRRHPVTIRLKDRRSMNAFRVPCISDHIVDDAVPAERAPTGERRSNHDRCVEEDRSQAAQNACTAHVFDQVERERSLRSRR